MVLGEAKLIRSAVRPLVSTGILLNVGRLRFELVSAKRAKRRSASARDKQRQALREFSLKRLRYLAQFLYAMSQLYAEQRVESSVFCKNYIRFRLISLLQRPKTPVRR